MSTGDVGSLFQEEIIIENYFAAESCEAVYGDLRYLFDRREPGLVVVTAEAGAGKTMFCRRLAKQENIPVPVFFFDTVKSFGDVVARVAAAFDITFEEDSPIDAQIDYIGDILGQRGEPVLLVFDKAESLYLATLERVRRFYDRLCQDGVATYVLFVGRPEFLENYKQLLICNFAPTQESFITLGQLSFSETGRYLWHVIKGYRGPEFELFFRPEFIENLYLSTSGNYRAINTIARKWLEQPKDAEGLIEALQNRLKKEEHQESKLGRLSALLSTFSLFLQHSLEKLYDKISPLYTLWQRQSPQQKKIAFFSFGGGVLLLAVLAIFASFWGGSDRKVPQDKEVSSTAVVFSEADFAEKNEEEVFPPAPIPEPSDSRRDRQKAAAVLPEKAVVETGKEVIPAEEEQEAEIGEGISSGQAENLTGVAVVQEKEKVGKDKETKELEQQEAREEDATTPVISSQQKKVSFYEMMDAAEAVLSSPLSVKKDEKKEEKIVELYPLKTSKYRDHIEGKPLAAGKVTEVERLIQNRFVAGMGWRNVGKESLYTIRVAQLPGEEPERLDELFTARQSRKMVADFYLFSKGLDPEYVVVFYGEFSSREAAKKALGQVAAQFPHYSPSVMTIKAAMADVHGK